MSNQAWSIFKDQVKYWKEKHQISGGTGVPACGRISTNDKSLYPSPLGLKPFSKGRKYKLLISSLPVPSRWNSLFPANPRGHSIPPVRPCPKKGLIFRRSGLSSVRQLSEIWVSSTLPIIKLVRAQFQNMLYFTGQVNRALLDKRRIL